MNHDEAPSDVAAAASSIKMKQDYDITLDDMWAELSCWAQAWTSLEPFAPPSPSFGSRLGMETAGPAPLSRQQKVAAMLSSAPLAVLLISCRD